MTVYTPQEIGEMLMQVKATPQPDGSVIIDQANLPPEALEVLTGSATEETAAPEADLMEMFSGVMGGGNGQPY